MGESRRNPRILGGIARLKRRILFVSDDSIPKAKRQMMEQCNIYQEIFQSLWIRILREGSRENEDLSRNISSIPKKKFHSMVDLNTNDDFGCSGI
jgi:hypothetical protein